MNMVSKLFIVCGPSGVGKTTVAKYIGSRINAEVITSENVITRLFQTVSNDGKDQDFTTEELERGYEEMIRGAWDFLNEGRNVILDGVFRSKKQREAALELTADSTIINVTCPEHIVKERVTKRFLEGKQPGGFKNHLYLKRIFEPIEQGHHIVDSSKDIGEQLESLSMSRNPGKRSSEELSSTRDSCL